MKHPGWTKKMTRGCHCLVKTSRSSIGCALRGCRTHFYLLFLQPVLQLPSDQVPLFVDFMVMPTIGLSLFKVLSFLLCFFLCFLLSSSVFALASFLPFPFLLHPFHLVYYPFIPHKNVPVHQSSQLSFFTMAHYLHTRPFHPPPLSRRCCFRT